MTSRLALSPSQRCVFTVATCGAQAMLQSAGRSERRQGLSWILIAPSSFFWKIS
jgi:hypothetical protein